MHVAQLILHTEPNHRAVVRVPVVVLRGIRMDRGEDFIAVREADLIHVPLVSGHHRSNEEQPCDRGQDGHYDGYKYHLFHPTES